MEPFALFRVPPPPASIVQSLNTSKLFDIWVHQLVGILHSQLKNHVVDTARHVDVVVADECVCDESRRVLDRGDWESADDRCRKEEKQCK